MGASTLFKKRIFALQNVLLNSWTLSFSQNHKPERLLYMLRTCRDAPGSEREGRIYKVIDHLGFVQVDTNYVVERAHHHTMLKMKTLIAGFWQVFIHIKINDVGQEERRKAGKCVNGLEWNK